jgi:nicotinate-nucleotide pyrophosphorylase (carboxylating)
LVIGNCFEIAKDMSDKLLNIEHIVALAIAEDIGDGDHTSLACIPQAAQGKMQLLVKQEGIIAGVEAARYIFRQIDAAIEFVQYISDGTAVNIGDVVFTAAGRVVSLLQAERLVLNFMQRMSGIATQTARYTKELQGLTTKVIDTRKTTPGMRALEKMAVTLGGGGNHRMGLYDMILIKDNHIDFAGGIEQALHSVHAYLKRTQKTLPIEIEVRSLDDVRKVMQIGGIQRIMLDNFDVETTREAVTLINGKYETESSGGITLQTLRQYAECGVDYISVGALTHHINSIDLSLKAI